MTDPAVRVPPMRLFTALWPSPRVRDALGALRDRWLWPAGAALVDTERLHVTLHFLGAVETHRVPQLVEGLDIPVDTAELRLDAGRQRVWPGGIAVLELEVPDRLQRLHARLGEALVRLGFPAEPRPWRPHVTFARRAPGATPPQGHEVSLPTWPVDGFALVRSVPGAGYDTLHRFAARKAEA